MINNVARVNETALEPLQHYGPVTALHIAHGRVLAGCGPTLKVFDSAGALTGCRRVFARNKIHAVAVSPSGAHVFVAGARLFAVLDPRLQGSARALNEWIVAAAFVDDEHVLVLTAHNLIYKLRVRDACVVEEIHCSEKLILYSGSIHVLPSGEVLVVAGTVMDGVVVWDLLTHSVVHTFTDHAGSIFGAQIDPLGRHLVLCLDDRSIKLYDWPLRRLLATGWGHGLRIWTLRFVPGATVRVFSTGEDCTVRTWQYVDGNPLLQPQTVAECHLGKHVWSGDCTEHMAVSGGADGRIVVHAQGSTTAKTTWQEIAQQTGASFAANEMIKQYCELGSLLVVLTSHGQVFARDHTWQQWELPPGSLARLTGFGLMQALGDAAVIASRTGDLLVAKQGSARWVNDEYLGGNKVANMLCHEANGEWFVLLDCPNPAAPLVLRTFAPGSSEASTVLLEQPQQAFTVTSMFVDPVNRWLVLGSRHASVAVYDLATAGTVAVGALFKKISTGDTVTSTSLIASTRGRVRFLITVRDGVYMYVDLSRPANFSLEVRLHNKVSRGFIEGGYLHNNNLILYGFKSSRFYVFNESQQIEVTSEHCGGLHRQWQFWHYPQGECKFVYTTKAALNEMKSAPQSPNRIINSGTHGREIRSVAICPQGTKSRLLMTASEDTIVRLGRVDLHGNIETFWCFNAHVSGLQRVAFLSATYAASSAANEEFIIWEITDEASKTPLVKEFARLEPSSDIPDLRIMDFASTAQLDQHGQVAGFVICTVYSDSRIKVWQFSVATKAFELLSDGRYTTCCILNVHLLTLNGQQYIMTGATDGHLAVWQWDGQPHLGEPIIHQQLHQSGIKVALILSAKPDSIELITGGDDNALVYSTLSFDGALKWLTRDFVETAASATITLISKISAREFLVTSVDQVVRKWAVTLAGLRCTAARYTTVADTGCSDVAPVGARTIAVIGGAGLSAWSI